MKLASVSAATCAIALFSSGALASIPGNIEQRSNEGILHVCLDREPGRPGYIVCDEQVDPFDPQSAYTGSECAAVGLDPVCTIDFLPRVKINGRLALFNDDQPLDGSGIAGTPQSGLTIDLTFGLKNVTLVELFDGTKIGNWNEFGEVELVTNSVFDFTNLDENAFQFSNGNLTELGLAIRDLAQEYYTDLDLSDAVPVLVEVVSNWNKVPVDGISSGLGSGNFYRVVVRFARVRP